MSALCAGFINEVWQTFCVSAELHLSKPAKLRIRQPFLLDQTSGLDVPLERPDVPPRSDAFLGAVDELTGPLFDRLSRSGPPFRRRELWGGGWEWLGVSGRDVWDIFGGSQH